MKHLHILLLITALYAPKVNYAQSVTVRSAEELYAAIDRSAIGGVTKINVDLTNLAISKPITLPKQLAKSNLLRRLIIDFQGCAIYPTAALPYVIGRDQPIDQAEADNIMQSQAFTILNAFIDGKSLATNGIVMRATYHDRIENCTVVSCVNGISEEFGMNSLISQCEVRNCSGYGIAVTAGTYTGAATNNSGSNMATVENCRVFPKQGQTACYASIRSGNTGFYGNIVEFAVNQIPLRGFLIDNSGSTTCKAVTVDRTWLESVVSIANFDIIASGGTIDLVRAYPQKNNTQVKVSGTNYTQVNIDKWGNMIGKMQAATNNGIVWRFSNNGTSYDYSSAANWVNGVLPISFYVERFGADQSWQLNIPANRTFKVNGKNVVTQ